MSTANFVTRIRDIVEKYLPKAPPDDPDGAVTIATLQPVMEAQAEVMRTRLEAEGIPCFIVQERTYYVDPIRLRVRRADAEEALAILKEMEESE